MASTRPQTALKPPRFGQNVSPALQKLLNKQIDASNNEGGESVPQGADSSVKKGPDTVAKGVRNGVGFGVNADKNLSNPPASSVSKTVGARPPVGAAKPSDFRRGSQVSVPSVFKQELANSTSPLDSRRSSQVNVPEAFKVNSKPAVPETNSSEDNKKPKPFDKSGSTFPKPPPNPKPPLSSAETTVPSNSTHSSLNKKANEAHKTENNIAHPFNKENNVTHPSNKESNVTHPSNKESTKFKLSGVDELQLKSSDSTSASSSQPLLPSEDKVIDFKSMLRSTKAQTPTPFAEKKAAIKPVLPSGTSLLNRVAATEAKQASGQDKAVSNGFTKGSTLPSSFQGGTDVAGLSSRLQGNLWKPPGQNIKKHQDPEPEPVLERKSDSKKFKKVKLEASLPICASPEKPALPGNIDLAMVKQQYQKALQLANDTSSSGGLDENTDEIYNDGMSMDEVVSRTTNNKRQSERISIIPDMSAEEEGATYVDGLTVPLPSSSPLPSSPPLPNSPPPAGPDEVYVDAETERQMEEMEQLYEDEQTFALSAEKIEEEKKRIQREEAEAKKKEEKEKKEKEKEEEKKRKKEQKEQKEKAKKEKEEMQMRKKFGLTGTETGVGEGTIKQDIKAWIPGGLSLKKGQVITIIRLDNNPANKWLIKSDNTMGYVDSSIIEVDPSIIRQVMASQATGGSLSSEVDDDQPVYDDVPHDGHPNDLIDDGEIYEECP